MLKTLVPIAASKCQVVSSKIYISNKYNNGSGGSVQKTPTTYQTTSHEIPVVVRGR